MKTPRAPVFPPRWGGGPGRRQEPGGGRRLPRTGGWQGGRASSCHHQCRGTRLGWWQGGWALAAAVTPAEGRPCPDPVAEVVAGGMTVPPAKEPPCWRRRGRPCQPRDKHGWCPGDRRLQEAPAGHQRWDRWDRHTRQVAPIKRPSRTWKRLDMARPPDPKPTLGLSSWIFTSKTRLGQEF